MRVSNLKKIIENFLNNNKASNIISIDLKKKSHIADYMIIASGTSSRHLQSLSENLILELKKTGIENCKMEGKESEDWKLVDAIDIIVHLFHPEKRNFYDLEKMWSEPIPKEKAMI
ncbi:iojap family protein [SAR11 cluster bacterium PRT-SC02]|nr:iojap family protein [SAR11 cluster bacterium PRT-SC02]